MPNLLSEPPSTASLPLLVGKNSRGYWTVRDPHGLSGGFFINRTEALHYARLEAGHAPGAVIMTPDGLELDLTPAPHGWARSAIAWVKDYWVVAGTCAALVSFALEPGPKAAAVRRSPGALEGELPASPRAPRKSASQCDYSQQGSPLQASQSLFHNKPSDRQRGHGVHPPRPDETFPKS